MMNPKQLVIDILSRLSEDSSLEEVRDETALAFALYESMESADRGEVVSHDEVMREMRALIAASQQPVHNTVQ